MMGKERTYTLLELNQMVRQAVETGLPGDYWVVAELSEMRENHGHCYMQLVEKDERGNTPVAIARANCWRSTWTLVSAYFQRVAGRPLSAGMKVELKVYPQFHEAYGFSWIVTDINPEYTLGDLARRRQEIISRLKAEGVFDMQKQLRLPLFAQRIAVVSSATAAGYGDFRRQLEDNSYGLHFTSELFAAVMQGEQVEQSIIAALDAIYQRMDEFDAVVIIRGGGATVDMSGFDTLALAENVANFPLPVLTGIGHDRDESVLDMVSYLRVKTPTAAAAFLVEHLAGVLTELADMEVRIGRSVSRTLAVEKERLARLQTVVPQLFRTVGEREHRRIDALAAALSSGSERLIFGHRQNLQLLEQRLQTAVKSCLAQHDHSLQLLCQRVASLDPQLMLRRGYSMTLRAGHPVGDSSQLRPGDELVSVFEHGRATSTVSSAEAAK